MLSPPILSLEKVSPRTGGPATDRSSRSDDFGKAARGERGGAGPKWRHATLCRKLRSARSPVSWPRRRATPPPDHTTATGVVHCRDHHRGRARTGRAGSTPLQRLRLAAQRPRPGRAVLRRRPRRRHRRHPDPPRPARPRRRRRGHHREHHRGDLGQRAARGPRKRGRRPDLPPAQGDHRGRARCRPHEGGR